MVTKAEVKAINSAGNRCTVRMPLFENASSSMPIEATALVNITPGIYGNIEVGDVVFIAFEENAIEKPIIIGKLFKGASAESQTRGGNAILSSLKVGTSATIPASTLFEFPSDVKNDYKNLKTPKKIADYIKWLEKLFKSLINQVDTNFRCFKNWTQWQLRPEHIEIDDGNIDTGYHVENDTSKFDAEDSQCRVCNTCLKSNRRHYATLTVDKSYPNS